MALIGFVLIPKLSVRLNPSNTLPSLTVSYNWPYTSPLLLEKEVTSVLEGALNRVKGISKITSRSSNGAGRIILHFEKNTNLDNLRFEVATIIRQLYKKFPKNLSYPSISVNKPEDTEHKRAFLSYNISAPLESFKILKTVQNQIEPIIGSVQGIDKIEIAGANAKELVFYYNLLLLKKYKISKKDIVKAVEENFLKASLGNITYRNDYFTLSIDATDSLDWNLPIKNIDGKLIHLNDIVKIKEKEQEAKNYFRINANNAITLSIYNSKNSNIIFLSDKISKKIEEIESSLPKGYSVFNTYNASEYLNNELNKIYKRCSYTIIILLLFILIIYKNFKYLLITVISLIANIGIAFLLYYLLKVEIQLYSLAGITISLGLVIDNTIVMIDHLKKINNINVFVPILASTLTTIGALFTIYFLDESYRINLLDFAVVIIINLSVSLLVALLLIPALMDKISLKKEIFGHSRNYYKNYKRIIKFGLKFKKFAIFLIILLFGIPIFLLPHKLESKYESLDNIYNSTLGKEWINENIRPSFDKYLGGSFRLFNYYVFKNASYKKNKETKLFVEAYMDKGITVHQMNELILNIENYLKEFSEIKQIACNVYSGEFSKLEITFKDNQKDSPFPFYLKTLLVNKVLNYGGIEWNIYGVGDGFDNIKLSNEPVNFIVEAKGYNYNELFNWTDTLRISLQKNPRVKEVILKSSSNRFAVPSYEYQFILNKEQIAMNQSSPFKIYNELKSLTLSKQPSISITSKGEYIPIRVESKSSSKIDIWDINNTPIDSLKKYFVLKNISLINKKKKANDINKINQEYIRYAHIKYIGSTKFGQKFLDTELEEFKNILPLGYQFKNKKNKWLLDEENENNYFILVLLIFLTIYFICAVLFESFKQPFVIISVIPISFIGVFLTFYIFRFNFDQGGLASFLLLSGITVNASIFIIYRFNKLKYKRPDEDYLELYIEALSQKIFPVILTIVSTILGFLPFIINGQNEVFWFSLGVGTIGGLIFSIIGILFYLPLFSLKRKNINV